MTSLLPQSIVETITIDIGVEHHQSFRPPSPTVNDHEEGKESSLADAEFGVNRIIVKTESISSKVPASTYSATACTSDMILNDKNKSKSSLSGRSLRFESGSSNKDAKISWTCLNKFVDTAGPADASKNGKNKKQILFGVSGEAAPGQMVALMGPSGSGKTTLLNILGGRGLADVTGEVRINGAKFRKSMKRRIAYVLQEDIFFENLTVRQQLYFTCHLRLPDSLSRLEKEDVVNRVIRALRLEKCADTTLNLVSGGEKKRCNVATELLTSPRILLLDEPTSGLDATAANVLIQTLRLLADDNITILTSIHQPSSKVFYSFDKLLLLADGHMAYNGPPQRCLSYLATLNYVPPADYNPADFVMDLVTSTGDECDEDNDADITISDNNSTFTAKSIRARLIEQWANLKDTAAIKELTDMSTVAGTVAGTNGDGDGGDVIGSFGDDSNINHINSNDDVKYMASYRTQFAILLERALIVARSNGMTRMRYIETVGMAVCTGLLWYQLPADESSVPDKVGFIFFFQAYWFVATLYQGMMAFLPEREIILKERAAGSYRLSAYFLSKSVSELPIRMIMPLLFLLIAYPMSNLNPSVPTFIGVAAIQLLTTLCGESVGTFVGTTTLEMDKALVYATLLSMGMMIAGGFYTSTLPAFIFWVRYVTPFKYCYAAACKLVFSGGVDCKNGKTIPACANGAKFVDAEQLYDYLNIGESLELNVSIIIVFLVFFRVAAYLSLRYIPHNSGRK